MNVRFKKPVSFAKVLSSPSPAIFQHQQRLKTRKIVFLLWSLILIFFISWNFAIIAAPLAKINGYDEVASAIYHFFSHSCHQIDSRSFHIHDAPFAVCARCFGFYIGFLVGLVAYPFVFTIENRDTPHPIWLILSVIPTATDWSLGFFGIWNNTHLSRAITAFLLGTVCVIFIVPMLTEFTSLLVGRRALHSVAPIEKSKK